MNRRSKNILRVAACQIGVKSGDLEGNLEKHLHFINEGHKVNADVLLFPEYSLCGTHFDDNFLSITKTIDDPCFKKLKEATGEMATIVGFAEEGLGAQFYNSSVILQNEREPFIHRKINLCTYGYWAEGKYFAQGSCLERFLLPGSFNGVIMICADLWNPALVHLAALNGANIIFTPIASGLEAVSSEFSNPENWNLTLRFYSMIYGMPIVMANLVGTDGGLTFYGDSCIVNAQGKVIEKLEGREEGLIVADLDYDQIRKARYELPTVRDANLALIRKEMDRISHNLEVSRSPIESELPYGRSIKR